MTLQLRCNNVQKMVGFMTRESPTKSVVFGVQRMRRQHQSVSFSVPTFNSRSSSINRTGSTLTSGPMKPPCANIHDTTAKHHHRFVSTRSLFSTLVSSSSSSSSSIHSPNGWTFFSSSLERVPCLSLSHARMAMTLPIRFSTTDNRGPQNENGGDQTTKETEADSRVNQPRGTATLTFVETEEDIVKSDDGIQKDGGDDTTTSLPHPKEHYTVPIVIRMPDMSDQDDENNTVEKWYKRTGDVVKRNDVLCDIGTPDFTFGMVTDDEDDALMGEIHVEEGSKVPDNTPICTIYHYDPSHQTGGSSNSSSKDAE